MLSDREGTSSKIRDVKTRDTPTLSRRPSKKRRVLSDDDYEDDRDLSPPPDEKSNSTKVKRDGKGKVKASTSTSTIVKIAKNEKPPTSKTDDINIEGTVVTREEQEKAEKNASEVSAVTADVPQKKKLPTIKKKTKPPGAVPPTLASAPPSTIPSPSTKIPIALASATGKETTPVTTLNPSGSGDFDLRDSNTWQSLLGKVSLLKEFLPKHLSIYSDRKRRIPGPALGSKKGSFLCPIYGFVLTLFKGEHSRTSETAGQDARRCKGAAE